MKKNNKGYTLVEILATIVILGILSSLGFVAINNITQKMRKNHFAAQEKAIVMAAKSFSEDNKVFLPKRVGEHRTVTLEQLTQSKYISKVLGYDKKACVMGYVDIFKYDKELYSYKPYLKCTDYETSKDNYGGGGVNINIDVNKEFHNPTFGFTITASGDSKIINYNYVIYKYGVETVNSDVISVSRMQKIEKKDISLKNIVPGKFKIVVESMNNYGIKNKESVDFNIVGIEGPMCGTVSPKITSWINKPNVTVSVQCIDKSGGGCLHDTFTKTFTKNAEKNFIEIEDNNGTKTNCVVSTYLDNVPPTKPVITNPHDNTWFNDTYDIEVESEDETSGIESLEYKYDNGEWTKLGDFKNEFINKYKFKITIPKVNNNQHLSVRVKDRANNYSEVSSTMIKLDVDKPEIAEIINQNDDKWVNFDYNIIIKSLDKYSGIESLQYRYIIGANNFIPKNFVPYNVNNKSKNKIPGLINKLFNGKKASERRVPTKEDIMKMIEEQIKKDENTPWETYSNSTTGPNILASYETPSITTEMSKILEIKACDYAGNCSNIKSTKIKIDKTPPSITNIYNSEKSQETHGTVKLQATIKDSASGIDTNRLFYAYNKATGKRKKDLTYGKNKLYGTWSAERNNKVFFIVYDKAGNKATANMGRVHITPEPPAPSGGGGGPKPKPSSNTPSGGSGGIGGGGCSGAAFVEVNFGHSSHCF